MPILGLGLHMVVALFCAIHAMRNRQQMYWLFILFAFPLLGSIVYIAAIWLPHSRLERQAFKAVSAAAKALDPTREVREARAAFDETPTAQNQMRLAAALLDIGNAQEAAQRYEACLTGPFANDPDIRLGAAHAFVDCERYAEALGHLEPLARERPDFRAENVALLLARSLAGTGRTAEARAAFEAAVTRFDTYQAKAELAIFCWNAGDDATAERMNAELEKLAKRWSSLTRELNAPVMRRVQAARKRLQATA